MNFKFFPIESRIHDFIEFPRLIYAYDELMETEKDIIKNIDTKDYISFIKHGEHLLNPYMKEIQKFYTKGEWEYSDFPFLILRSNSIFDYENEEGYLNYLLSLDGVQIIQSIIYTMLKAEEKDKIPDDSTWMKAKSLSTNKVDLMDYIKDLPIVPGAKWNIFLIIDDPVGYMKNYVDLMHKLLPIYQSMYVNYLDEVINYGNYFEAFLNEQGASGLEEKTFGIVDSSMLNDGTNSIFISAINSYSLSIISYKDTHYFIWGVKIEDVFKAMKEKNENKLNERVLIFKNLGDKTRYEVVKLIASGESSTKKIAEALEVSSATISYHLNALVTAKIIKLDKSKNKFGYILDWGFIESAFHDLKGDLGIKK